MPQSETKTWLDFSVQQIAAESYLEGFPLTDRNEVIRRLVLGNNRIGFPETNYTRLTQLQAEQFVERFQIIDHHSNDASGFSASLLLDTQTNQYTLAFRSTEYRNQVEGGDWE